VRNVKLTYEVLPEDKVDCLRDSCNELMKFQQSVSIIRPELFDEMSFETRLKPSIEKAAHNFIVAVKDADRIVGYVYSNISTKETYSNDFATFFDMTTVRNPYVGCLSQFYIKEGYRKYGIGSKLFGMSMDWLNQFNEVDDVFIFVSNGNLDALEFYKKKGFTISHEILGGFITVLRN
jgi:ribosomal protein S18 acetylase RimI-like enzyme